MFYLCEFQYRALKAGFVHAEFHVENSVSLLL